MRAWSQMTSFSSSSVKREKEGATIIFLPISCKYAVGRHSFSTNRNNSVRCLAVEESVFFDSISFFSRDSCAAKACGSPPSPMYISQKELKIPAQDLLS